MSRKLSFVLVSGLILSGCGGSSSDSETTNTVTITNAPLPAVASLPYEYQPLISDNAPGKRFQASGLPGWATLDEQRGIISGMPDADDVTAHHPFQLSVTVNNQTHRYDQALSVLPTSQVLTRKALDFRATNYDGTPRPVRNDLSTGDLSGEVVFAQSHTVMPNGNFQQDSGDETRSVYKPRLVALREALLMFTPDITDTPVTVDVELSIHGEPSGRYRMSHPNDLPASDHEGRHRVEYSTRAWSLRLPWDKVRNGLSISFIVNQGAPEEKQGILPASQIDIGEASQIVFQSLRLGMLTHVEDRTGHFTLRDPVLAATDYFQTLPVSRMVMASYADMELDRVIIGNGKIYTDVSDTEGGIYEGDMRENVAKSQVSVGINQANYGLTSSNMRQQYAHVFKQITNHHAWGNYQNGRVDHGLSGGNGIGTLLSSRGNEASHEWGHAYGLGHYPGANLTEDGRWQRHHADSGWGFIAHRGRMRDNLAHNNWATEDMPNGSHYLGRIPYRYDSMSGGSGGNRFSEYTHYTGFSARVIQNDLARFPIPDTGFATGYKKWNTETGQYDTHEFAANARFPAPRNVGVPVATLLGGYDPDGTNAVIYPVFHGNYGNIFDLPEPAATGNACWITASNAQSEQKRMAVAEARHQSGTINQFHINLEASFRPTLASLHCRRDGVEIELTRTTFNGETPELPPVAIVGQQHGFVQLKARDTASLNQRLGELATDAFPVPDSDTRILLDSYSNEQLENGLDVVAGAVLDKLVQQKLQVRQARALVQKLESENVNPPSIREALTDLLMASGFIRETSDIELNGSLLSTSGGHRLSSTLDPNGHLVVVTSANGQPEAADWLMSARGSLHPADQPWNCLAPSAGRLTLASCDPNQANQQWSHQNNESLRNAGTGQCIDYAFNSGAAVMYGCHNNWNQKWQTVTTTDSPVLASLPGKVLTALYQN
ncbi:M66 family metalloprotease [Marinobacter halophilus]|uniref:Peptidase M66 domain-containing protein n=1 Tax=Marinobacter halophilus TaxID=1323740 RepID=A0A2T1KIY3_9GAMM|nr:M66 family metalloprotease [Marinobacter halophilus]PSF09562.1 hypothetical protein C7H08_03505 [Marinobacter halophilus]GGC66038.1 peptidase M66 [Marinobacter halophilus]